MRRAWLVLLVIMGCHRHEAPSKSHAEGRPAPAPVQTPVVLTDALLEAFIAAHTDGDDNPLDNVCTGEGNAVTPRYNLMPDGDRIATAWLQRKGFHDLVHYGQVGLAIGAAGIEDPPDPLVARYASRLDAAVEAQFARMRRCD